MAPCVDRHIADTARLIEEASAKGRLGTVSGVMLGTGEQLEKSAWESERAAQTLVHFPRKERAELDAYYESLNGFLEWRSGESDAWNGLAILDGPPKRVTDADVAQLRVRLQNARSLEFLVTLNSRRQLDRMKALGVTPVPPSTLFLSSACQDIHREG